MAAEPAAPGHRTASRRVLGIDRWLDRWLPLIAERAGDAPVLEIGCGHGDDTAVLAAAGLRVVAFDLSAPSVAAARLRVPSAHIGRQDVRDPWPVGAGSVGVVLASLSLHYFAWTETLALADRVRHTLRPGGVLVCRLNATDDVNFGARGHREIEPGLYDVDGSPKRFFGRDDVLRMFPAGWQMRSLEAYTTRKYGPRKALWEAVVERRDDPGSEG